MSTYQADGQAAENVESAKEPSATVSRSPSQFSDIRQVCGHYTTHKTLGSDTTHKTLGSESPFCNEWHVCRLYCMSEAAAFSSVTVFKDTLNALMNIL